jgi:RNA polymerase sigma-70 factor (ECF subfamily)
LKKEALHTIPETELVNGCKDNNGQAQKALYNAYVETMMIVCLRYVVNHEDAKEVLSDAFFNFFKNINAFTYLGEGSLKAWLKKITVNQCLMHLRKRQPLFINSKEIETYEDTITNSNILDDLNIKEIMKLVQSLPDGYRTVFNLYVFEGKNHREIGEMLGISENTSKSQLHKARTILKKKISLTV